MSGGDEIYLKIHHLAAAHAAPAVQADIFNDPGVAAADMLTI